MPLSSWISFVTVQFQLVVVHIVMVAVRTCMVVACSSIDWLLQLPGAVLLIGRAPFVYWGVSDYCALTEVFLLPRIQLCSLHRLRWLLLSYDYRHDYFLVSSMLKLSSLKPSKYTRWILASIGRLVTICGWTMQLKFKYISSRRWSLSGMGELRLARHVRLVKLSNPTAEHDQIVLIKQILVVTYT